jgi:hypothetical protein
MVTGIENLKAMRLAGYVPSVGVLVWVGGVKPWDLGESEVERSGAMLILHVAAGADIAGADWRAAVGQKALVMVDAFERDQRAGRAVCMALVGAGARRVVGFMDSTERKIDQRELSEAFFDYTKESSREPADA